MNWSKGTGDIKVFLEGLLLLSNYKESSLANVITTIT